MIKIKDNLNDLQYYQLKHQIGAKLFLSIPDDDVTDKIYRRKNFVGYHFQLFSK